jgi:Protein of unknown function (DUF3433)
MLVWQNHLRASIIYGHTGQLLVSKRPRSHRILFIMLIVFVLLAALWRKLDYEVKRLMPWAEMAKGPTIADKSLLLDYVSPTLPTAMYRSLRNRHFVVFTSIMVFIVMKIIMIFSTGLLVLENALVDAIPTKLLVANVFNASNFGDRNTGQSSLALAVYGVQKYNLPFPAGTTSEYTFQSFKPTKDSPASPSAILNGTVEYFAADLDCELADASYRRARASSTEFQYDNEVRLQNIRNYTEFGFSVSTTNCNVNNNSSFTAPSAGFVALVQPVNCSDTKSSRDGPQRLMIISGNTTKTDMNEMKKISLASYAHLDIVLAALS